MNDFLVYRVTDGALEYLEITREGIDESLQGNGIGLTTLAQKWAVQSMGDSRWKMNRGKEEGLTTLSAPRAVGTSSGTVRTNHPLSGKELEKIAIEYFIACQR